MSADAHNRDERHELPAAKPEELYAELLPTEDDAHTDADLDALGEAVGLPSLDGLLDGDKRAVAPDADAEDAEAPTYSAGADEPIAPSLWVPEARLAPTADETPSEATDDADAMPAARDADLAALSDDEGDAELTATDDAKCDTAARDAGSGDGVRGREAEEDAADDDAIERFAPTLAVSASEARYASPSALSLLAPAKSKDESKEDDGDDPRNSALAVAGGLRPGEQVFIRTSIDLDADAERRHREQIAAMEQGKTPKAGGGPIAGRAGKVARVAGRVGLRALRATAAAAASSAGKGKGNGNGKGGSPVKPGEETIVLSKEQKAALDNAHDKLGGDRGARRLYRVRHTVAVVGSPDSGQRLAEHRQRIESKLAALGNAHQRLVYEPCDGYDAVTGSFSPFGQSLRERRDGHDLLMDPREIALLATPHGDLTNPRGVKVLRTIKSFEPTRRLVVEDPLAAGDAVPVGVVLPDSEDEFVQGVHVDALTQHVAGFGRSGSGKSVWTEWLTYGLAKRGQTVMVLDPHGALADNLLLMLAAFAPERLDDVVVLDFSSRPTLLEGNPFADDITPHAIGFNPLAVETEDDIDTRKSELADLLEGQLNLSASQTPRARNYLNQMFTALMHANLLLREQGKPLLTLLSVVPFLTDDTFRTLVVELCPDADVHVLYGAEGTYTMLKDNARIEHIGPILRTFQPLAGRQNFANVFSSSENQLDWGKLVKPGRIFVVKLSRFAQEKELGEFVGSLIIPSLLGSMHVWGRETNPFANDQQAGLTLVVDEAHALVRSANSGVTKVLAEARKFGFGAVLMTQYPDQYEPEVRKAIMGNTYSRLTFGLDPTTISGAANGLSSSTVKLTDNDILALSDHRYHGYAKFADSGTFTFRGLAPIFDARNPDNTYTARRGVQAPPKAQLQQRVAAVYRRSYALVYTPVEQLRARREVVTGAVRETPTGELSQPTKRTRMIEETMETLTLLWQQRIAAAAGAPMPTTASASITGPSATRPSASRPDGTPVDEQQREVFDPMSTVYGNDDFDPATTDIFGGAA